MTSPRQTLIGSGEKDERAGPERAERERLTRQGWQRRARLSG